MAGATENQVRNERGMLTMEDKKEFLVWNEDMNLVYGRMGLFAEDEFIEAVKAGYREENGVYCVVEKIRFETCIVTDQAIPAESISVMRHFDATIENFFIAHVRPVEE